MNVKSTTRIPAPRKSPGPRTLNSDQLRATAYIEFLYGFGAAPGIDLGAPVAYGRVARTGPASGGGQVWRQVFERGVTVANLGDEDAVVEFDRPYYDLDNVLRTKLTLRGHSAEVLRDAE